MQVLIAGGSGFLGSLLSRDLEEAGHHVRILTRRTPRHPGEIYWDGSVTGAWTEAINEAEAVINLTGYSLAHWPWTPSRKKRFYDSRLLPGQILTAAIQSARHRPKVFLQASGVNHYGLKGDVADEATPAAQDFLAQLTVAWEASTAEIERLGVRRVILRQAVVLARRGGFLPFMALPVRLFLGGPLGDGKQAVPWIHIQDYLKAVQFLLARSEARGVFNLISPSQTSNAEFVEAIARTIHRPNWLRTPAIFLKVVLGEMNVLVTEGRGCIPTRLLDIGFEFRHPEIGEALQNLLGTTGDKK